MDFPHPLVDPPSENESATTQPWEDDGYPSDSDDEDTSIKEHDLTAEVYNTIFLDGFRNAMITVFEEDGEEYDIPPARKKPPTDTSPAEAFRQGYNLAVAESIVASGGKDGGDRWRPWVSRRWRGLLWRLSKDEENSSSEKGLIFKGFRLCGMTRAGLESDYGSAKTVQRLKIFVSTRINARLEIIVSLVDSIVGFHRDLRLGVPQNCIADIRIIICSFAVESFGAISIQTHI